MRHGKLLLRFGYTVSQISLIVNIKNKAIKKDSGLKTRQIGKRDNYAPRKQRRDRLCGAVSVKISGKPIFWAKKELANDVFASFSFMRQTGLEAPPLAETHAETGFLCPLLRRFCHKGIYRNLSECAVVLCQNKDQTKTKVCKMHCFDVSCNVIVICLIQTHNSYR